MNIVDQLESMGLSLSLDQDHWFILGGLKKLPPETRQSVVELARVNKPVILEELKRRAEASRVPQSLCADPPPNYAAFCPDYWEGCMRCPDCSHWKLRFCEKYNRLNAPEVLQ